MHKSAMGNKVTISSSNPEDRISENPTVTVFSFADMNKLDSTRVSGAALPSVV